MQGRRELIRPIIQNHCEQGQRRFGLMRPSLRIFLIIPERFLHLLNHPLLFLQDGDQQRKLFPFLPAHRAQQLFGVHRIRLLQEILKDRLFILFFQMTNEKNH